MTSAEDALWGLLRGRLRLDQYVEDFLELDNWVSWADAVLGACFLLGLEDKVIRCDLPVGDFPLIKLINLVLFLNGSDEEVEEVPQPRHPVPAGTRCATRAHPMPRTCAYISNGSPRTRNSKDPTFIRSSTIILSPEPPSVGQSSPRFTGSRPRHRQLTKPAVRGGLTPLAADLSPPFAGNQPPFVAHISPPATASPPTDAHVPLGLLVAYEGMSWSPASEPTPRQRALGRSSPMPASAGSSPAPPCGRSSPMPASASSSPVPSCGRSSPVPSSAGSLPVPAPRQCPPVPTPRKCSPVPLLLPSRSPEPLLVPSSTPVPLLVPSSSPERPRESAPPERPQESAPHDRPRESAPPERPRESAPSERPRELAPP